MYARNIHLAICKAMACNISTQLSMYTPSPGPNVAVPDRETTTLSFFGDNWSRCLELEFEIQFSNPFENEYISSKISLVKYKKEYITGDVSGPYKWKEENEIYLEKFNNKFQKNIKRFREYENKKKISLWLVGTVKTLDSIELSSIGEVIDAINDFRDMLQIKGKSIETSAFRFYVDVLTKGIYGELTETFIIKSELFRFSCKEEGYEISLDRIPLSETDQ
ncbi:hypothetical protein CDIK_0949 [Cucumispora dikerogammari]|nr:hypothetical protein CDIK_0949 [Cucumispora dikerogammari]